MMRIRVWAARHPWWSILVALVVSGPFTAISEDLGAVVGLALVALVVVNKVTLKNITTTPSQAPLGAPVPAHDLGVLAARQTIIATDGKRRQLEVSGESYHADEIERVFASLGVELDWGGQELPEMDCHLVPEPWNAFDSDAVAVVIAGEHVGYLPAEDASQYGPRLLRLAQRGHGVSARALVWARHDGTVRARVTAMVPSLAALDRVL